MENSNMVYPVSWLQRLWFNVRHFINYSGNVEDAKRAGLQPSKEGVPIEVKIYGFITALENNSAYPRSHARLNTKERIATDPFIAQIDEALREIPFNDQGIIDDALIERFLRHTMAMYRPGKYTYEIVTTKGALFIFTRRQSN